MVTLGMNLTSFSGQKFYNLWNIFLELYGAIILRRGRPTSQKLYYCRKRDGAHHQAVRYHAFILTITPFMLKMT